MAELTTQERLQPSLLDRLTDRYPEQKEESRQLRVMSASQLRDCVTRDLGWLLNCTRIWSDESVADYPYLHDSVVNFGIPDLTGAALSGIDANVLENRIRSAILAFEPRLTGSTLQVAVSTDTRRMDRQSLTFKIFSEMWAQPLPLNLYLKTDVDLETGRFSITEGSR